MKGFKDKSGKFRPTESRNKSSISKNDALKEYTHSTLTSIRQEDAINFLKRKGIAEKDAVPFIQEELKEYPVARVGKGYGSPEVRNDEGIDIDLDDVQVSSHFRVIDDTTPQAKFLEDIRLPSKSFEDYDIERQMEKGLKELKKRGLVPEDAYAKFDDIGWEGMQLDLYVMTDENYVGVNDLSEFKGIRLSLQTWIEDDSDDQNEIEDQINDKLKEQFDYEQLAGRTVE